MLWMGAAGTLGSLVERNATWCAELPGRGCRCGGPTYGDPGSRSTWAVEVLGAVFGLALIVWFVWLGIVMLRSSPSAAA